MALLQDTDIPFESNTNSHSGMPFILTPSNRHNHNKPSTKRTRSNRKRTKKKNLRKNWAHSKKNTKRKKTILSDLDSAEDSDIHVPTLQLKMSPHHDWHSSTDSDSDSDSDDMNVAELGIEQLREIAKEYAEQRKQKRERRKKRKRT